MNFKLNTCLIFIFTLSAGHCQAKEGEIHYFQTDHRYEYRIKLLDLALSKTIKQWGAYSLIGHSQKMTQGRGSLLLEHNKGIDVAFFPTSIERENKLLAIKIPILQGILGYRVLLINHDNREAFSKISSLTQLKKNYTAGFGEHWADMAILEANTIPVMGVHKYNLLFAMLNLKRFDYIPRGINEAWNEVDKFQPQFKNIMVEPNIALYYPYYVYFFVSKSNRALADRIQTGLMLALTDGSFKALFLDYHQHLFEQATLDKRKLFTLENPTLPIKNGTPKLSWWLPTKND